MCLLTAIWAPLGWVLTLERAHASGPWTTAWSEALAFASLVKSGIPVRLSVHDSRRGTFNQRHSALIDIENENEYEYVPLENIAADQARCTAISRSRCKAIFQRSSEKSKSVDFGTGSTHKSQDTERACFQHRRRRLKPGILVHPPGREF